MDNGKTTMTSTSQNATTFTFKPNARNTRVGDERGGKPKFNSIKFFVNTKKPKIVKGEKTTTAIFSPDEELSFADAGGKTVPPYVPIAVLEKMLEAMDLGVNAVEMKITISTGTMTRDDVEAQIKKAKDSMAASRAKATASTKSSVEEGSDDSD